jgi:Respiratory-chain NADH dehydrogenase, 30 Kd subunit
MSASALRDRLGGSWTERADGWWRPISADDVRAAARTMLEGGARFAALVACPRQAGALRLSWHWDLQGTLLSLETTVPAGVVVPSIVDVYPGADWAERETRDYYAATFAGRASTEPLMLREGDQPGLLLPVEGGRG